MSPFAPVAIFAYNRPEHTRRMLESLLLNPEMDSSAIYVFCDGLRKGHDPGPVNVTRQILRKLLPARAVFIERDQNWGIAKSIISGVSEVIQKHGKIIVIEDDLVLSAQALCYFNNALTTFEADEEVMHIAGYMYPVRRRLPSYFFFREASCWGWATWHRAWQHFNPNGGELLTAIQKTGREYDFNVRGSRNYVEMLRAQVDGRINSWAIRWYASQFVRNGLGLHPGVSFVQNIGHDGSGHHCAPTQAFHVRLAESFSADFPHELRESQSAVRAIANYYRGTLWTRLKLFCKRILVKPHARILFNYLVAPPLAHVVRWGCRLMLYRDRRSKIEKTRRLGARTRPVVLSIHTQNGHGGASTIAKVIHAHVERFGLSGRMVVGRNLEKSLHTKELGAYPLYQKALLGVEQAMGWQDLLQLRSLQILRDSYFLESDLVHLHNSHWQYLSPYTIAMMARRRPLIWTLHDQNAFTGHCGYSLSCDRWQIGCGRCPDLNLYPSIRKDGTKRLFAEKRDAFRGLDMTLVVPSRWLQGLVEKSMLHDKEIQLIRNGIDHRVFRKLNKKQVRQKLGLPLDKKILAFAADYGRRNTWKGGHLLEEIFGGLNQPNDYLMLHIGGQKQVREGNWHHAGHIQDPWQIAEYLAASDLLINPSLADSFSLVTAEAMACGTPVIAFKTDGIPEIVDDSENGIIVPYHNTGAFVAAIQSYFESSDHHDIWRNRARHKIETNFTLDLMLENYAKLYETILVRQNLEFSLDPIMKTNLDVHQFRALSNQSNAEI